MFLNDSVNSNLISIIALSIFFCLLVIIFTKEYIAKIYLLGTVSMFVCLIYLLLDAPDVALTEAAIGACLSTVILIIFASKIKRKKQPYFAPRNIFSALIASISVCAVFYKISEIIPIYGEQKTPLNSGITTNYYIENTINDIKIDEIVAAILASYRGFDTLGETAVILIAAMAVFCILAISDEKK